MAQPPPYRPSDEEAAFLVEWAKAIGATEEEARKLIAEMNKEREDKEPTP